MDARTRTSRLAKEFIDNGDPLGWFEPLYATANGNAATVPWANLAPNPALIEWLEQHSIDGQGQRAIVVGCGLGDDAEELARRGFEVTAFDLSPTAIEWCQNRFSDSSVNYSVADVFTLPEAWEHQFDFVLEAYTIQAMPPHVRLQAIPKIAELVVDRGKLLVINRGRDADQPLTTVPFPLTKEEIDGFQRAGLTEISFEDFLDQENPPVRRFRALFSKT